MLGEQVADWVLVNSFVPLQRTADKICSGAPQTRQSTLIRGFSIVVGGKAKCAAHPDDS